MRPLIEAGYVYIGLSPLYRLKEGNKYIYLLDEKELSAYLNDRIFKNYEVYLDKEGKKLTKTEISKLINQSQRYTDKVKELANHYSIQPIFVEFLLNNMNTIKSNDIEKIQTKLDNNKFNLKAIKVKDQINISGYFSNIYYNLNIDENLIIDLAEVKGFNEVSNYLYIKENEKVARYYLAAGLIYLLNQVTPKYLNRLKGLGESDPEELFETTMDPEKRKVIKVEIDDFDLADSVMEILMGKKAELRRQFLADNTTSKELDI